MDFAQLRDADLGVLNDVAESWSAVSTRLSDLQSDHASAAYLFENGAWTSGSTGDAIARFDQLGKQLEKGRIEAKAIRDLVVEASASFTKIRAKLSTVLDEISEIPELAVDDSGTVSITKLANPGGIPFLTDVWQVQRSAYQTKITQILAEATDVDASIAQALALAAATGESTNRGFNGDASA
ncbi:MAG TPA: hypothetical protein H9902_04215 [Candidatus Stackebrandtia faecavium]|nr:hypothetical protein [Candidatus Stackebrandtia faecavium]